MSPRAPLEPRSFAPRVTLMLVGGLLLFLLVATAYVMPVLLEPAPPGAIVDYHKQRVMARLEGKVIYILAGSLLASTCLGLGLARPRGRARG